MFFFFFKLHRRKFEIKRYIYFELLPRHIFWHAERVKRGCGAFLYKFFFIFILISFPTSYAPARCYRTGQQRGKHEGAKREEMFWKRNAICSFTDAVSRSCRLYSPCYKSAFFTSPTADVIRPDESLLLSRCHFL
jgi:hypothetical protein